jgi:hypothetical protein
VTAGDDRSARVWVAAAAALVAVAFAGRLHNAFAYPALADYDAAGHALYVFALYEGHLPSPQSWSGFHPPLYYALGAALWRVLPNGAPVHAALRLLSAGMGFAALAVAWRSLRRLVPEPDAAAVAALIACAPVFAIATSMLGNETTCAAFATAALARTLAIPDDSRSALRHARATVALAALAALAKSTGLIALAVVGLTYLWRLRGAGARVLLRAALAMSAVAAVGLAPHYGRLLVELRSPLAVISGGQLSDAAGNEMATQPPGERHLADYASFPPSAIAAPFKEAPGMTRSVPGLLYATIWADGHGQFLPVGVQSVVGAAAVSALLGLLPTGLALAGLARILRDARLRGSFAPPLAHAALLLGAFLAQTWLVPRYSAVKASYLLSALLPAAIALAFGLTGTSGALRSALRAALLAIAAWSTFLTWWGWWR